MRPLLFHALVILAFVVVAWVNLLPKPYWLCVGFTIAETSAGLLIYVGLLMMMRRVRQKTCQEIAERLQEIKRRRAGHAVFAGDD